MRNTISLYRRNRGAALVAALLMITFVSMGFAIWVTVIGQHAHNGEFDAARIQRHVVPIQRLSR